MSRAAKLVATLVSCCVLLAPRVDARTPEALRCQSRVWQAVAQVAPSCRGVGVDRLCSGAALRKARSQAERILARRQSVASPAACMPLLCQSSQSPFACADTLVTGNGAPGDDTLDDWQPVDFGCLQRSARVLDRLAKRMRRCDGADRNACLSDVETSHAARLEQVVGKFFTAGASPHHCLFGSCRPSEDIGACVRDVVSDGGGGPPGGGDPGGGPPPPDPTDGVPADMTAQEIECRTTSPIVLAEYDERVAKCVRDADDVPQCILQAREKREEKVAGLLDKRVRPEVCFPGICTADQTPEACAATVFDQHTPDTDGSPGGDLEPDPAQLCRTAARGILDALDDDVETCRAAQAADPSYDVDACVQAAVDAHRPNLVAHLDEQLAQGIPPDECLPKLCAETGGQTAACADAAIASVLDAA